MQQGVLCKKRIYLSICLLEDVLRVGVNRRPIRTTIIVFERTTHTSYISGSRNGDFMIIYVNTFTLQQLHKIVRT